MQNADIPEDLRQIRSSPFYGYNNLDFVITGTRVRVAIKNTIDGLLWISPHLRTVTIKSFYSNWFSFKVLDILHWSELVLGLYCENYVIMIHM